MSYKSVLTYCDRDPNAEHQVASAVEIARKFDAHLIIAAIAYRPDLPAYAFAPGDALDLGPLLEQSEEQAATLEASAKALLDREALKGEATQVITSFAGLSRSFGALARFADLVVLPTLAASAGDDAANSLIEGALFDGDSAVLICPEKMPDALGGRIVIGWDGDRETLRAVRRAMPLLRRAKSIEIAVVDPEGGEGRPGADLALFLARHGLDPDVSALPSAGQRVSEVLRERLLDTDADLLVVGAYSHSRFREYVLGGVTRDILMGTRVPVLMAH